MKVYYILVTKFFNFIYHIISNFSSFFLYVGGSNASETQTVCKINRCVGYYGILVMCNCLVFM